MRVFIVEDSRLLRLANERALTKAGHHVIAASDGAEGLQLAREHKPSLIILDMMLPLLTGPSVLRDLREDPETASIPVMVLSSLPQCNEAKLLRDAVSSYFENSGLMLDKGSDKFVEAVENMPSKALAAGT